MAKSDFVPASDLGLLNWHDQFKDSTEALATTFGIVQADLAVIGEDNTKFHDRVAAVAAHAASAQKATKEKDDARQDIEQHIRALARRLKAHPAYTPALGEQLGIEGAEQAAPASVLALPQVSAKALPHGVVEVKFSKGHSEGVNIYTERDGDGTLTLLGRAVHSPYTDNRPLQVAGKPEVRKYRVIYVVNDKETGDLSEEAIVTCQP